MSRNAGADDSTPGRWPARARALTLLACLLAAVVAAAPALGQSADVAAMKEMIDKQLEEIPSGEAGVEQIMAELTERLTLTEDQQKDVRPSIEDTVASMEKTRDRFKASELTPMALVMQLQMSIKKAGVLIEPVLTPEQLTLYKSMQQEQRREMMQAMSRSRAMAGTQQ